MAVPKKRTSNSVTNTIKSVWKAQAKKASQKSLSLAKSILKKKNTSFIYKETGSVPSVIEGDQEKE